MGGLRSDVGIMAVSFYEVVVYKVLILYQYILIDKWGGLIEPVY
jgi:hypothetical protein